MSIFFNNGKIGIRQFINRNFAFSKYLLPEPGKKKLWLDVIYTDYKLGSNYLDFISQSMYIKLQLFDEKLVQLFTHVLTLGTKLT